VRQSTKEQRVSDTAARPRCIKAAACTPPVQAMAMRAYAGHVRSSRSVPCSDVRVECIGLIERLRANALKEHAPHQPVPRRSVWCTQRPVVRAERCAGARRSRCGATAAVGQGQTGESLRDDVMCTCNTREMSEAHKQACNGRGLDRPRPTADRERSAAPQAKAPTSHTHTMVQGAYEAHRCHRSSVPGSDVRVERLRPVKRLRAEPRAQRALATSAPSPDGQSSAWCTPRQVDRVRAERGASARDSGQQAAEVG
jgi:hypothetical protein